MVPWQLLYHWPIKTLGRPPWPHWGDGKTKALQGRGQQGPRRHICEGVRGPFCCARGCVSETQREEGHTSHGKVKSPEKSQRLVGAVTSGLAHLEGWLVSISLFLFLHGAFKEP